MRPRAYDGRATMLVGAACGALGVGLFLGGLFFGREQTMISYLTAYAYVLSVAIGALVFLVMTTAMGAVWPVLVRRAAEAIVGIFPLLAVLILPVFFEMPALYSWVRPDAISDVHERELVMKKLAYLNTGFFIVRVSFYLLVLVIVSELWRTWSLRQDEGPAGHLKSRLRWMASASLGPLGLAITFLAIDLVMSTEPSWPSSMFGLYFTAGGLLAATGLIALLVVGEQRAGLPLSESHRYALGRCLLTFLLVWGYTGYFQFMLIWIADKPDEAKWYVLRARHSWWWMSIVFIFILHLCVPFVAILPYRVKRSSAGIAAVGLWVLCLHFFDVYWMIHPHFRDHFDFNGMDVAMLAGVAGLCVAFGAWRMRGHAMWAFRDPLFHEALRYKSI